MRKPEPWYWLKRKSWYVQVNGRQVKLGDDPTAGAKGRPPMGVMREYYRVMAVNGQASEADRAKATVAEVCEVFLATKDGTRAKTQEQYAYFLKRFAEAHQRREFRSIRKDDVIAVAEAQQRWCEGTKHGFVSAAIGLCRWARDAGYLNFNTLAGWNNPYNRPARTRGITDEEFNAIMEIANDVEFKQVLMFLRGTGCRPGELRVIEARHYHGDTERGFIILESSLHKTGRRTGKARELLLPKKINAMVRALILQHPKGPIFRNSRDGKPWGAPSFSSRFRSYRDKLGLNGDLVPYMIRHRTLTDWLMRGTSVVVAARMAGHHDTTTIQAHYFHPEDDGMLDVANAAYEASLKSPS